VCVPGAGAVDSACLYNEECDSGSCVAGKCAGKVKVDSGADGRRPDAGPGDGPKPDRALSDGQGPCPSPQIIKSSITTATTLDGCYLVQGNISVSAVLTIAPGSTVVFAKNAGLRITSTGTLKAVGTAAKKILFTGEQKTRGYWIGIELYNTNSPENAIQHATIEYAGSTTYTYGEKANLALTSSGSSPVGAAISDCILREGGGYGFYIADEATLSSFANNTVTANTLGAGYVEDDAAGQLDKSSTYKGNTLDLVRVAAGTLSASRTWPALDVRYVVQGELSVAGTPGVTLTIEAGATLAFLINSSIKISGEGALTAKGTASAPITFTHEAASDKWRGLEFYNANSANNILDHVVVEYGGTYSPTYGEKANIALTSSSSKPVRLTLTNSTIRGSDGYGFYLAREATLPSFAGNTVTQNTLGAGFVQDDAAGQLDKTTTCKGNTVDMIWVEASALTKSQTWPAMDVKYVIEGTLTVNQAPGIRLTIAAGATLAFRLNAGISVGSDGGLIAKGTAAAPITFTRDSVANNWRGLLFHNSNTTDNALDHAVVEGGGSSAPTYGGKSNVAVTQSSTNLSHLTLTNSTIRDSVGYGVWAYSTAGLTESGNTFSNNALGNVYYEP
jgi:hypothetical protein